MHVKTQTDIRWQMLLMFVAGIVVGVILLGLWSGVPWRSTAREQSGPATAVGTTGIFDPAKAKEQTGELGEKVAETLNEASITAKIKAKMALDDSVKARRIDVTTHGSTVTVRGTVGSVLEHDRAIALARETAGVASVVDQLGIER